MSTCRPATLYTVPLPGGGTLRLGDRCLVMGILNVTPDSFADAGRHLDPDDAVAAALQMEADGADLIDIGGESTRPGADPVSADEELSRVLPVLDGAAGTPRRADLDRHLQGRRGARRDRRRRGDRQRRQRPAARSGAGGGRRPDRAPRSS